MVLCDPLVGAVLCASPAAGRGCRCAECRRAVPPDLFSRLKLSDVDLQQFEASIREQIRAARDRAKKDPTAETIASLGLVLHAYDQYDRASACYERARAINPESFQWNYYLGLALADAGRAEAASVALREAVRLAPADVPSRLKLAENILDRGDTEESRALSCGDCRPSGVGNRALWARRAWVRGAK